MGGASARARTTAVASATPAHVDASISRAPVSAPRCVLSSTRQPMPASRGGQPRARPSNVASATAHPPAFNGRADSNVNHYHRLSASKLSHWHSLAARCHGSPTDHHVYAHLVKRLPSLVFLVLVG